MKLAVASVVFSALACAFSVWALLRALEGAPPPAEPDARPPACEAVPVPSALFLAPDWRDVPAAGGWQ